MTFLHLSDLHLVAPGKRVSGIDSMAQLQGVLAYVQEREIAPSFVVVSGDLTDDGAPESYARLAAILGEIGGSEIPVLLTLGNHDDRANYRRVMLGDEPGDGEERLYHSRSIEGLRVIVLDSLVPGAANGELGAAQLAWLEEELQTPAPRGTLIVLHHCCRLAAPAHHFPDFILRDAPALEAIVAAHQGEILGVLAGHSHQSNASPFGGTVHITAPAILCQLDFFAGDDYVPIPGAGFNLCQIIDGQLVSNPVRVSG